MGYRNPSNYQEHSADQDSIGTHLFRVDGGSSPPRMAGLRQPAGPVVDLSFNPSRDHINQLGGKLGTDSIARTYEQGGF